MIYDGVLSQLLSIDMGEMEKALRKQFGKKVKAADLNMGALKAGAEYAQQNLTEARSVLGRADAQDRRA